MIDQWLLWFMMAGFLYSWAYELETCAKLSICILLSLPLWTLHAMKLHKFISGNQVLLLLVLYGYYQIFLLAATIQDGFNVTQKNSSANVTSSPGIHYALVFVRCLMFLML